LNAPRGHAIEQIALKGRQKQLPQRMVHHPPRIAGLSSAPGHRALSTLEGGFETPPEERTSELTLYQVAE
jgi:hypothetical protein